MRIRLVLKHVGCGNHVKRSLKRLLCEGPRNDVDLLCFSGDPTPPAWFHSYHLITPQGSLSQEITGPAADIEPRKAAPIASFSPSQDHVRCDPGLEALGFTSNEKPVVILVGRAKGVGYPFPEPVRIGEIHWSGFNIGKQMAASPAMKESKTVFHTPWAC